MKKKIKCLLVVLIMLLCCGCQKNEEEEIEPFTITFFYKDGCGYCKGAKEVLLEKIKTTFPGLVTIEEYSVDDEDGRARYDAFTGYIEDGQFVSGKLADFPLEYVEDEDYLTPMIVVGDKYAFLGYNSVFLETYIADMKKGLRGETMSQRLSEGRYFFRQE